MDADALVIEALSKARLLPGAVRVTEGRDAETWKGTLIDEDNNRLNAYIKRQSPPAMLAEFLSALLGRALGLPIPRPYVTLLSRSALPESRQWADGVTADLAFALEDARAVSFKRFFKAEAQAGETTLRAWDKLQEMLFFDEWIANTDRHLGNLLFDGRFWMIDHGRALHVPWWPQEALDAERLYDSRLCELITTTLSEHERYQWRKAGGAFGHKCARVEAETARHQLAAFTAPELANDAAAFLSSRAPRLVYLLCQRLKIPELSLASSS